MSDFHILLIDDEPAQIISIQSFLQRRGYRVSSANSGTEGVELFQRDAVDMLVTDYRMPDMNGLQVVREVQRINPITPVVVLTAYSDTDDAVQVMKEGAFDYLSKPIDLDELELLVKKAEERNYLISENEVLRKQLQERFRFDSIISQSAEMEKVLNTAGRVAQSKTTVLIRGESGTGKELIAKAIHFASDRKEKPLITVNCAALTETLLESELFGHEKGSFTGAVSRRIGRFEQANGGTLFIDEIGDIPIQTQVKLLRALQFGEIQRVGGNEAIKVDVRIISATNRNLEEMISNGTFREDLFYRINVVPILLPPLRHRKTDIPILIDHFLEKFAAENKKHITGISREARDSLFRYNFPGNIRELENMIERAVVMTRSDVITLADLPNNMVVPKETSILDPNDFEDSYLEKVAAFETAIIKRALELSAGNQSRAAKLIGISERHLRSRMQKLNIVNPRRRA